MRLYLIRHAQSRNNALADQTLRVYDPLLTEAGQEQARLLAAHMGNGMGRPPRTSVGLGGSPEVRAPFDRIFCSPMRRSLLTTAPIAARFNATVTVWPDICEEGGLWQDHGEEVGVIGYSGITRQELTNQFPGFAIPDSISATGWWRDARESDRAFLDRVTRVADELLAQASAPETLALVTHGAFMTALLRALLGNPLEAPLYYHHDNTGVTLLRFRSREEVSVRYLNRVDHLPTELIT